MAARLVEAQERYDSTRSLGHVNLTGAPATELAVDEDSLAGAWYLAQTLIAADAGLDDAQLDLRGAIEGAGIGLADQAQRPVQPETATAGT